MVLIVDIVLVVMVLGAAVGVRVGVIVTAAIANVVVVAAVVFTNTKDKFCIFCSFSISLVCACKFLEMQKR